MRLVFYVCSGLSACRNRADADSSVFKIRRLFGDNLSEILTQNLLSATVKVLNAGMAAGEPNFGVYPPSGGGEPSFPNPSANLVSTKRERIFVMQWEQGLFLHCFCILICAAFV